MYFTCEGRYHRISMFHLKFLAHLVGKIKMNMPYFLLRSLIKMSSKVRARPKTPPHCIFHRGLIKMLIINHLRKLNTTWENLLFWGYFDKQGPSKLKSKKGKKQKNDETLEEISQLVIRSTKRKQKGLFSEWEDTSKTSLF